MVTSRAHAGRDLPNLQSMSADSLFAGLDQCRITGGAEGISIEVMSIHVTPDAGAWVQLQIAGEPAQDVILHLPHSRTVDDAIAALNAWGETPAEHRPRCIDVAPFA
jgi:hypothetical protein